MKTAVIIVAAGKGRRFGSIKPKQYLYLKEMPVLSHSIKTFALNKSIQQIQIVINKDHEEYYKDSLTHLEGSEGSVKILEPCYGGEERSLSVKLGLIALSNQKYIPKKVLIHDAARPLVTNKIIESVLTELNFYKAVFPSLPMVDTVWKFNNNKYKLIKERDLLIRAQTPQGFNYSSILKAHLNNDEFLAFDDISLVNKLGIKIQQIPGCETNLKITTLDDLERAERLIK